MKLPRRRFLHLAAGAAALPAASRAARAQSYPTRLVRIVVGLAPGGTNDLLARLIAQWLSERLGQSFVVENRPGAGGNIATELVVKSPADGYTLLLTGANNAINASLYDKLNFNFIRDIAAVASIVRQPSVVIVNPAVPVKTIPELVAHAKANPGKLNFASAGIGTSIHVAAELFKMMAGVDMVHVPYRGAAPAMTDLIAGQVQVFFIGPATAIEHIKSGKVRALAVTTTKRWQSLPDLPTVSESVPGYEATNWFGIVAPKNTPEEIIGKLNAEINAGLSEPAVKARLAELGDGIFVNSSAEFATFIAAETDKWAKVVKFAGIKAR